MWSNKYTYKTHIDVNLYKTIKDLYNKSEMFRSQKESLLERSFLPTFQFHISNIMDNTYIDNEEPDSLSISSNIKKNIILDNQSSSVTFNNKLSDVKVIDKQTKVLFKSTYQKETISDNMKAGIRIKRED